jgi:hypothetical protein
MLMNADHLKLRRFLLNLPFFVVAVVTGLLIANLELPMVFRVVFIVADICVCAWEATTGWPAKGIVVPDERSTTR